MDEGNIKLALYGAGCTQEYCEKVTKELMEEHKKDLEQSRREERNMIINMLEKYRDSAMNIASYSNVQKFIDKIKQLKGGEE